MRMLVRAPLMLVLLSSMLLEQASAKKEWGICPDVESNVFPPNINTTHFSGLWYEYLVTPSLKEGKDYDCASWLWLKNSPEEP